MSTSSNPHIRIFDTTLRDGEQSPGASMTHNEKLELAELMETMGVDVIEAEAKIIDPWTIQVGDRKITTRNIVVATGASPFIPPIKGLETAPFYTSETLWR